MKRTSAVAIEEPDDAPRLIADRLEGPRGQCVAIKRAALEAQQAALLQLAVIIKQRANLDEQLAKIARQLEASAAASRLADGGRVQLPTNIRGTDTQVSYTRSIAVEPGASDRDLRSEPSSANDDTPEEMLSPSMRLAVIVKAGTSLACLLAVLCAGLMLFFYASLPVAKPYREVAAEQALRKRDGRGLTSMPRPEVKGTGIAALLAAAGSTEGPPQMTSAASSPPPNTSTAKPAAPLSMMSIAVGVAPNMDVSAARLSRSEPLPSHHPAAPGVLPEEELPGASATTAQPPVTPALAPPSSALSDSAERFVPVVFTHKDREAALRAFAELQRRYPKLMAHRQSELQLVDTGINGIWYRLLVLPTGSHQEASETCGRLGAAGYDRCWVKAY